MPLDFAESSDGLLVMVNGVDAPIKWDGLTAQADTVGVAAPVAAPVIGSSGTGTISGTYNAYVRFLDAKGNPSNLSPISNEIVITNKLTILYTSVPVPAQSKVRRKQILRNTDGQQAVYYVDVDTDNLTGTSFSSTNGDSLLATKTAVPLLATDNTPLANRFGLPPNFKNSIAEHKDRLWMAGEVEFSEGACQVTLGSKTVLGVGTDWKSTLAGRLLYVIGSDATYEIESVVESTQTITLTTPYLRPTDLFAIYTIKPFPGFRKLMFFSEPGLPEAWPAANAISIPSDGDDITGLMNFSSFLFVLERKHIYRYTMETSPLRDGAIFLSCRRGCINNRCWVEVDGTAYIMDEGGFHSFNGARSESIGDAIQNLFLLTEDVHLNMAVKQWFHAVHFPNQETIRWFVAFSGSYLPRHAIAFDYRQKRWWIEDYPVPIGDSTFMPMDVIRSLVGSDATRLYALWYATLDGVDAGAGTVRGTVTSATYTTLVDSQAVFPPSRMVGSPVVIVSGKGRGQRRIVAAADSTSVTLTQPWLIKPDTTSVYQLGGIQWQYRPGWFRFAKDDTENPRRIEVLYEPTSEPATMELKRYVDFDAVPETWFTAFTKEEHSGVASARESDVLTVDLTKKSGFAQQRLDGRKDAYLDGPRHVTIELKGVSSKSVQKVYQITLDGVSQ